MVLFATALIKVVFDVPFHGSILSFCCAARRLCVLSGIGIGTVIATFTHSAYQAQLTSFFVNPLLTTASGAITPAEAIPGWLQPLVKINPIRHFSVIARSSMIKGSGIRNALAELSGAFHLHVIMVSLASGASENNSVRTNEKTNSNRHIWRLACVSRFCSSC